MRELAFLGFLHFYAPKMLKSNNKGDVPFDFLNSKQLLFMKNPSKMPLSTLKMQFLFLRFSTQATLMSSTCPLDNFLTKSNCESLHKYNNGMGHGIVNNISNKS